MRAGGRDPESKEFGRAHAHSHRILDLPLLPTRAEQHGRRVRGRGQAIADVFEAKCDKIPLAEVRSRKSLVISDFLMVEYKPELDTPITTIRKIPKDNSDPSLLQFSFSAGLSFIELLKQGVVLA